VLLFVFKRPQAFSRTIPLGCIGSDPMRLTGFWHFFSADPGTLGYSPRRYQEAPRKVTTLTRKRDHRITCWCFTLAKAQMFARVNVILSNDDDFAGGTPKDLSREEMEYCRRPLSSG
jgi:hypothetical protein